MSGYNFSPDVNTPVHLNRHYLILAWIFVGLLGLHNWQLHQSVRSQTHYIHQLSRKIGSQHQLTHHPTHWSARLKEIALALPKEVYFEQLALKQSVLRLQGKTQNANVLKSYLRTLRQLSWVKQAHLEQLKAPTGEQLQSFILTLSLS